MGTRRDNKAVKVLKQAKRCNGQMRDPKQGNKRAENSEQKTRVRQGTKKAGELAAGARTRARKLSSHVFLLAAHLFFFLTFSSLESVIG